MMAFPLKSWVRLLLLLLAFFFLLAAPTFQDSLPLQGKLSLSSIKTESISSVNRRGGGGSRGGGGRSSSGRGGGGNKGKGISGRGRAIPVYAGGAAGAHGHHRNGAVLINPGKTNLGFSVLVLAITLFKYFLAC